MRPLPEKTEKLGNGRRRAIWAGTALFMLVNLVVSVHEIVEDHEDVLAVRERVLGETARDAAKILEWNSGALRESVSGLVAALASRPDAAEALMLSMASNIDAVAIASRGPDGRSSVQTAPVGSPTARALAAAIKEPASLRPSHLPRVTVTSDRSDGGDSALNRPLMIMSLEGGGAGVGGAGPPIIETLVAVSPRFFDQGLRGMISRGAGLTVALNRADGGMISRWPVATPPESTAVPAPPASGVVISQEVTAPGLAPMRVTVSGDLTDALAAWRHRSMWELAQFAILAAAVAVLAVLAARRERQLRRLAETAAEREALYHGLFHGSKAVKLLIDPRGGDIVDANPAAGAFYGWSREELRGMRISDINTLSPDEVATEMRAAAAEKRDHFHFRHRLASGEIRDVEIHSGPLRYDNRDLLYSIVHDITDRRRLELERQRLVTAIDQSRAAVVITDIDGRIEYVNRAFTQTTGYTLGEVVHETPRILKSGHTSDEEYQRMWTTLRSGKPWSAIFLNKRKDGSTYWEHAQISPVIAEDGAILNYVAVKENITALKMSEDTLRRTNEILKNQTAELARVNQELEQFAYVASHDLRQPLRATTAYLRLLRDKLGGDLDPEAEEFLRFAEGGAQRMDALIVGLLEYSRVGRLSRASAPVSLNDIVSTTMGIFAFEIADRRAKVTLADDFPTVIGSEDELRRLFDNLIGNALKYRAPDRAPEIEVGHRLDPDGTSVVVWVADNGIGMAPENHERAFGMFQRLVGTDEYDGTGIGLAVCRKIVQHHHGEIWIESELGRGTRILFRLPIARAATDRAEATSTPARR